MELAWATGIAAGVAIVVMVAWWVLARRANTALQTKAGAAMLAVSATAQPLAVPPPEPVVHRRNSVTRNRALLRSGRPVCEHAPLSSLSVEKLAIERRSGARIGPGDRPPAPGAAAPFVNDQGSGFRRRGARTDDAGRRLRASRRLGHGRRVGPGADRVRPSQAPGACATADSR